MSKTLFWLRSSAAAALVLTSTSCYYDAYGGGGGGYGPAYGGGGYAGGGYGGGYYGGGSYVDASFASGGTSFVYTSSPQWFYDPLVFAYYDRYRGCYYDSYLGGYYPRGYCPRPIYGAPYPGGWRPGYGVCPPPYGYRDRFLSNYRNRVDLLRERNYAWARSVRERNDGNVAAWQNRRIQAAQNFQNARADIQQRNGQLQARNQANFAANQARYQQNLANIRERQQGGWQNGQFGGRPQFGGNQSPANVVRQDLIRERIAQQQGRNQFTPGMAGRPNFTPGQVQRPQFTPGMGARPNFSPGQSRGPAVAPQFRPSAPSAPAVSRPAPAVGGGGSGGVTRGPGAGQRNWNR